MWRGRRHRQPVLCGTSPTSTRSASKTGTRTSLTAINTSKDTSCRGTENKPMKFNTYTTTFQKDEWQNTTQKIKIIFIRKLFTGG
jgi:hypothetical protein